MAISIKQVREAEARYRERKGIRNEHRQKIAEGRLLEADTPERVRKRIDRLSRAPETAQAMLRAIIRPQAPAAVGAAEGTARFALERMVGNASELMGIYYLEKGFLASRSIGRVHIRTATGRLDGYGTGFMVSPRLILTNNHVLNTPRQASVSSVEFNYQRGADGRQLPSVLFDLDPTTYFVTDELLDYTLVAVKDATRGEFPLQSFGWNRLIEEEGKVIIGEALNIIQHPDGALKQLALRENKLIDLLPSFLHYETDTAPGSSGAPVFSDVWEVVGLHHSGVPRRDDRGRILTRDGRLWTEDMGEDHIHWVANEGIRISRILTHVKNQRNLSPAQRRLRNEVFEATPPIVALQPLLPSEGSRGTALPAALSPFRSNADGSATWTIPLQISVKVGATAPLTIGQIEEGGQTAGQAESPAEEPEEDNEELRATLAELEAGRRKPYYDAAKDAQDRNAYYQGVPEDLNPEELYQHLSNLLQQTHSTQLSYKPSTHVYPFVDLHPSKTLCSIYSGEEMDTEEVIREDFRIELERQRLGEQIRTRFAAESTLTTVQLEEAFSALEASLPFNCEHVVPQSWFGKREPMKGDLHHLFACETGCNSFRGNIPYFEFADFPEEEEAIRSKCGKVLKNQHQFEPVAGKGPVARATLYFLLRYPGEINRTVKEYTEDRIAILLQWHTEHPVTDYERHRNMAIFEKQGNRNPFIDFPDWAEKINFQEGLG
jgi:endonuclease G, mitochondrial